MNTIRNITTAIALAAITLASQAETVSRSVPLTTDVTRVNFTGVGELHLTQGEDEYIKLTAPEEMLDKVEARIKGRSLYLGKKNNVVIGGTPGATQIRFDVQLKRIDAIRVWGSANAWIGDLQSDRLKVVLAGNSKLTANSIKAWEMKLALAGSCNFKGDRLETGEADMKVSGSGTINIAELQSGRVDVSVAGSSDINLDAVQAGKLDTQVSGSASLSLKGKVDHQELEVAGSSNYKAQDLISNTAYIEVMGSGDVDVNVQKQLTAELSRGADTAVPGSKLTSAVMANIEMQATAVRTNNTLRDIWNDNTPIYQQLRDRIISLIIEGELKEGEAVPSVRQVSSDYRINHLTVARN